MLGPPEAVAQRSPEGFLTSLPDRVRPTAKEAAPLSGRARFPLRDSIEVARPPAVLLSTILALVVALSPSPADGVPLPVPLPPRAYTGPTMDASDQ